jgi:hypothetical protein
MRVIAILTVALFAMAAAAEEVYKTTDEAGNVIYSDKPSPDAETITIQEAQTVPADKASPFEYKPPPPGQAYTKLEIASPANDEAIRPEDENSVVQVTARVTPQFRGQDAYVFTLDGKEHKTGKSASISLTGLDRGTHQVSVKIVDPEGKTMISSDPISFHILKTSVQPKQPAPKPKPPQPKAP